MNQTIALNRVVRAAEAALTRFPAIWAPGATLAFSGGKDSIALASAMAAMDRTVRLRAVDMGYAKEWRGRIERLAAVLGQPIDILVVADLTGDDLTEPGIRRDLAVRRAFLDSPAASDPTVSPCTNCYNCKILSLVDAARHDVPTILFAHHATDALSSFLKSALMHIDRWEENNLIYERNRFRELGTRVALDLRAGSQIGIDRLIDLLRQSKAHTSEPPIERRALQHQTYTIGRPMFFLEEAATIALVDALGVAAESSGCGHSAAASTRTPREIVHYELLPLITETAKGREAVQCLSHSLAANLNEDGTAQSDVRQSRHLLLGAAYKGGPETLADRL
ncbi:adenine nucleotide alpha hydrolase family protein [Sphingopyxis sp. MSC1_008]|jgi:tRNA(Ile)-lysidine synthase TilS/MesJ|uniref:hypothetical protein n=1 Tax=Sphingopyxis sp. MSC1_008 TaxID=2909265 RepID=UPI0020BDC831|nr:hypothetical protein [Sphingopyxis sp. MSC1_008]